MNNILTLKFDNFDELVEIILEPTINADFFANSLRNFGRPADRIDKDGKPLKVLINEFLERAQWANEVFKFNWNLADLTLSNFNAMHRDIETFDLSRYPPWSEEKGTLFNDLHAKLHLLESTGNVEKTTSTVISVKWFEPTVPWPEMPKFVPLNELVPGDVVTDFPHVGKEPIICLQNNDNSNLKQACKLPDACPPGFLIKLVTNKNFPAEKVKQNLINWYYEHQDQLSDMFSVERMLQYFGAYRIGTIKNKNHIDILKTLNTTGVSVVNPINNGTL